MHSCENLIIDIDNQPLGGYRHEANALKITHKNGLSYAQWDPKDMQHLAEITRRVLNIFIETGISNILVMARQNEEGFSYCMIPYPSCTLYEKLIGLVHSAFGGRKLTQPQLDQATAFWTNRLENYSTPNTLFGNTSGLPDAFCTYSERILTNQEVASFNSQAGEPYKLLHDNRPIKVERNDLHFLIVPWGAEAHATDEEALVTQDFNILNIAQQVFRKAKEKGFDTTTFVRRFGAKLQGQLHPHAHVNVTKNYPTTLWGKIALLWHEVVRPSFTKDQLPAIKNEWVF